MNTSEKWRKSAVVLVVKMAHENGAKPRAEWQSKWGVEKVFFLSREKRAKKIEERDGKWCA